MTELTWLHISDWHQGFDGQLDRDALKNRLIEDIEKRIDIDPDLEIIDFIIFSGDVAYSGKAEEYRIARKDFFDPLLEATDLKSKQLFIVPGNHDLNRKLIPSDLTTPLKSDRDVYNWLSDDRRRSIALKPFQEFSTFVKNFTHQDRPEYASTFVDDSKKIAIMGLNSAWMCGRKGQNEESLDIGSVLVGKTQLLEDLSRISDSELKIAVMHHPINWLAPFDRRNIERLLVNECDFILTGHQHDPEAKLISNERGFYGCISTGASCLGLFPDDPLEINGYNFVRFNMESREGIIFLRKWSDKKNKWIKDIETGNDEGVKQFGLNGLISAKAFSGQLESPKGTMTNELASISYKPEEFNPEERFIDELYRPRSMIDKLANELKMENILKIGLPGEMGDPIEPIKSIILTSLDKHDQGTLVHGLNAISKKIGYSFESSRPLSEADMEKISDVLYFHFSLVGSLAIEKQDIYACSNIISAIKYIGIHAENMNYGMIVYKVIIIIEELGEKGANNKFGAVVAESVEAIKEIGLAAKDMPSQFKYVPQWVAIFISRIATTAIRNYLIKESQNATRALGDIGMTFARYNIKAAASSTADGLGKIASECITPEFNDIGISAITYLRNIGIFAAKNGIPSVVGSAAESLGNLVYVVADRKHYDTIPLITWSLGAIGVQSAGDEKLDMSSHTVADRLDKLVRLVSELADFNRKSEVIPQAVSDLGKIGLKAAENGITIVASRVAYAFGEVGLIALKNNIGKHVLEVHLDSIYDAANKTAEMNNNMGSVLYQIGRTYNMLGFYQSAEKASRRALEVDSTNNLARIQLHNSLSSQGNIDEAKEVLKEYHRFEREKKQT